jgi:hypothetical protein
LEADQGDTISGRVLRSDAAALIVHALATPAAAAKTFELRRSEALDAKGKAMTRAAYTRLFLKLAPGEGCLARGDLYVFVYLNTLIQLAPGEG